jgi:membrane dipeptidase
MNALIQQAREVALGILQPSQSELDRGLALHRDAFVGEAYGFSPRAALDGDAVKAAVEAGASEVELQDMTEEMGMTRCVTDPAEREEYLAAWEASGVTCIFQNAGEESQAPLQILKRLARFTYVTDMLGDFVRKAASPEDLLAAKREGRRCLYFSANGVPLTQQWSSVEEELGTIRVFFQLGCRMMHLTYNRRNMIGDGCAEPADAGLSDFGRAVVAEMNRVGVLVDVAHAGQQTSLEAARASTRPMVASHSGCWALTPHFRCKTDAVLRAIADSDGYVGICCIPAFLGGSGDIRAMLDHIDYAVRLLGADHVAIGTDVAYTSANAASEYRKLPKRGPARKRWESFWPAPGLASTGEGNPDTQRQSMAWTNWPIFTVGLVQRGYSDDDIMKILGGNMLRVARAVFPA